MSFHLASIQRAKIKVYFLLNLVSSDLLCYDYWKESTPSEQDRLLDRTKIIFSFAESKNLFFFYPFENVESLRLIIDTSDK